MLYLSVRAFTGYPFVVALFRTDVLSAVRGLPAVAATRRKTLGGTAASYHFYP